MSVQTMDTVEGASRPAGEPPRGAAKRASFFEVYKPGQGYYIRLGSGIFFGVLILWGAQFAYEQMGALQTSEKAWTLYAHYGVPVLVLAVFGLAMYWLTCVNRRAVDFLVATEGEMKKVSWSSRREVIGSTKVVIATTFILGFALFVVDLAFMLFFSWIGVLKIPPGLLRRLFGLQP